MKRISWRHKPGIDNSRAPYWRGERAEMVIADRRRRYEKEAEEKAAQRAQRRRSSGASIKRGSVAPSRLLRRLYRALKRRKTLAARQRVQQRIRQLEKDHAAAQ